MEATEKGPAGPWFWWAEYTLGWETNEFYLRAKIRTGRGGWSGTARDGILKVPHR